MEPTTQVHGAIIIMDFSGLGFRQAKSFTPAFSDRLLSFIQVLFLAQYVLETTNRCRFPIFKIILKQITYTFRKRCH